MSKAAALCQALRAMLGGGLQAGSREPTLRHPFLRGCCVLPGNWW
ncbi:MAG: hypothetical protein FAZ92_01441 [Accumulibacter sp.]|nr:MAG: hypothetical protein FAZ92_01441 [Accumulibacter sp.]